MINLEPESHTKLQGSALLTAGMPARSESCHSGTGLKNTNDSGTRIKLCSLLFFGLVPE
jgi:hypothetical protein